MGCPASKTHDGERIETIATNHVPSAPVDTDENKSTTVGDGEFLDTIT